jgi:hypothetical protein
MSRFVSETANVLHLVQDTLRPQSFDDYLSLATCLIELVRGAV